MQIPDWLEKVNTYIYLALASLVMIVFSMAYYQTEYIILWLLSYIYGILGYAFSVVLPKGKWWRTLILGLLLLIYIFFFVGYSLNIN